MRTGAGAKEHRHGGAAGYARAARPDREKTLPEDAQGAATGLVGWVASRGLGPIGWSERRRVIRKDAGQKHRAAVVRLRTNVSARRVFLS